MPLEMLQGYKYWPGNITARCNALSFRIFSALQNSGPVITERAILSVQLRRHNPSKLDKYR